MSQAPTYTRSTGFAADERNNAGGRSTVLTADVDAELDSISQSINQVIANQVLQLRDDGVMRDYSVPVTALGTDVLKLLVTGTAAIRGAWLTATVYAVKDLVTQSGNTYICAVAHTSGVFATDLGAVKWILFQVAIPSGPIDPKQFAPDGVTVDASAINAAIIYANGGGGGTVRLSPGTFTVSAPGVAEALSLLSKVTLQGSGKGATIIKLANGADDDVINMIGVTDVAICDLTIDGNRANQTQGVHGIRSAGVDGLLIENVRVQNTNSYGIGLEQGNQIRVRVTNVDILNTSDDGIDIKNPNSLNDDLMFDNITITNPGLGAFVGQTAIDIRGPARLSNIFVRGVLANNVGIRFRNDGPATGTGGKQSSLTNFDIRCSSSNTTTGVSVVNKDVQVSNGYINGGAIGVEMIADNITVKGVTAEECTESFRATTALDDFGATITATRAKLIACHARRASATAGTRAFRVTNGCVGLVIEGCSTQNVNEGVNFDAGTQVLVVNNDLSGATNPVNDAGTLSRYRNNKGWVTENTVLSAALAIDSTGAKAFTVNHGLAAIPSPQDVTLTVCQNTAVIDARFGGALVEAITSTTISGHLFVTTASATGGATAFVSVGASIKAR